MSWEEIEASTSELSLIKTEEKERREEREKEREEKKSERRLNFLLTYLSLNLSETIIDVHCLILDRFPLDTWAKRSHVPAKHVRQ